jgi:hypothetical protein
MGETATIRKRDREIVAAHVDPEQRRALVALAAREETWIATIVWRALRYELDRVELALTSEGDGPAVRC